MTGYRDSFEFPQRLRAELEKTLPASIVGEVIGLANFHVAARNHSRLTPSEIRQALEKLEGQIGRLLEELHSLHDGLDDAIVNAAYLARSSDLPGSLIENLRRFDSVLARAWQAETPSPGKPPSLSMGLVLELAKILANAGLPISASVNGPLCLAGDIIFDAICREPDDKPNVPKLVARALAERDRRNS